MSITKTLIQVLWHILWAISALAEGDKNTFRQEYRQAVGHLKDYENMTDDSDQS